ncbi:MAG: 4-alpha-glucanotransferase [Eubacteriaceae bacterium]
MSIKNRGSGVLLHLSSLPGAYGIGTMGMEAKKFIDKLWRMGFTYWQILPFSPPDHCFSPYKSTSAFAGNPLFIDLENLFNCGLITQEELKNCQSHNPGYVVDFQSLLENRSLIFRQAFQRISNDLQNEINDFLKCQKDWLVDFALYTVLSELFNEGNWTLWEDKNFVNRDSKTLEKFKLRHEKEINYQIFLQYLFYKQWSEVKSYANAKGIKIIGDVPIYLALESSDVWSHPDLFQLDEKGQPVAVAGVPPDYFSQFGQLWGNPLYHWETMKKQDYHWWINRLEASLKAFDLVRIDHFRGFSAYWSIPGTEKTAQNGKWIKGPGMDFFNRVFQTFSDPGIIAEDLGVQDQELSDLLKETNFPGMRILEFGFIEEGNNPHLPHNYTENTVAYTGTHDNNTLLGTIYHYSESQRKKALDYVGFSDSNQKDWGLGGPYSPVCRSFIRCLWQSNATLVILPLQDLCGYGEDTKMNSPGVAKGNWRFRITQEGLASIDEAWVNNLNQTFYRSTYS